jgi:hypothetical protein
MQGGKNWILPKEINAKRFFWDSHWLEIWKNQLCHSMGPNGGSVAMMDSGITLYTGQSWQPRAGSGGVRCVRFQYIRSHSHHDHRIYKVF